MREIEEAVRPADERYLVELVSYNTVYCYPESFPGIDEDCLPVDTVAVRVHPKKAPIWEINSTYWIL